MKKTISLLNLLFIFAIMNSSAQKSQEKYANGQIKNKGTLVNGKKDGEWISYYETGQIATKDNYSTGKLNGKHVSYHDSVSIQKLINNNDKMYSYVNLSSFLGNKISFIQIKNEGNYSDDKKKFYCPKMKKDLHNYTFCHYC